MTPFQSWLFLIGLGVVVLVLDALFIWLWAVFMGRVGDGARSVGRSSKRRSPARLLSVLLLVGWLAACSETVGPDRAICNVEHEHDHADHEH